MTLVDLHLHSTASDGWCEPRDVVAHAADCRLTAIALTDHDTISGVAEAAEAGRAHGVVVVPGCEFSVAVWWGELHLLGYFLPIDDPELETFLVEQRQLREDRATAIVERLARLGAPVTMQAVRDIAGGAAIGRPHIGRALVDAGHTGDLASAFDRYISDRGPAFVPRALPDAEQVIALVRDRGGITSAAHLKRRGTRDNVRRLAEIGVDAVEVLHPAHDPNTVASLRAHATRHGLLMTGGSDWHGAPAGADHRGGMGAMEVPRAWLDAMEHAHLERAARR